ncbi:MAG: ABC transporter ATP-binding protein/permease [Lachnospiraceae bacterium]|nr:ABC transporter ATP-binding protein/permease [Lachnospiraceae bacterium]
MSEKYKVKPRPHRRIGGPGPPGMPAEKAKDFKGTIKKLLIYMGNYKYAMLIVSIFAVAGTIFNVYGPKLLSRAITELFNGYMAKIMGSGGIDYAFIAKTLLFLLFLYVLSAVLNFIQGFIMAGISQKISYRFRQEIAEKINRIPLKYFEANAVGDVLSRITNDVDTLGQNLNQSILIVVTSVTTIIGILVMMLSISPLMTLIALVILPITGILLGFVVKHSQKYFTDYQKYLGKINGQIEEVYTGHNIIKAYNREDMTISDFSGTNDRLYESGWKSQFISGLMMPMIFFIGNLGYVAVAVIGSILTINGSIQIGDIAAFIQYVRNFTQPIQQIAQITNLLQSTAAAAERIFEFLDEEEEVKDPDYSGSLKAMKDNDSKQVVFENVHFGYEPGKTIINDFSLAVASGKMVAIVGPTGAGKTTIVKLLMRFYDVESGRILVNGRDIRDYKRSDLRQNFGMVLQDTWLFKGTIMENIRYGKLAATDTEVINAAKAAYAHRFITTLPEGYQMELNEDASNVSQGQKQLLTIARAILADNPILILDEATSSVDTRTEARIQKAMANLMAGRTSFVIAHRLSTTRDADVILVMREGDIVEQGSHEELISASGFYAELYQSQFEQDPT